MSNSSSDALKWLRLDKDGQSDIFYSSLGAIVASTLLALHLNVPPPRPEPGSGFFLRRLWEGEVLYHLRYQLSWAMMVVIAPELLVSLAFGDWRAASQGVSVFGAFGRKSIRDWTLVHASFANMGGIRLKMIHSGQEIPLAKIPSDLVASIPRFLDHINAQPKPLNIAWEKLKSWRLGLFEKISVLFHAIKGFSRRPFKGKELEQTREDDSQGGIETVELASIVSDHDENLAIQGTTNTNPGDDTPEEPQAGPSTADQTSVDLEPDSVPLPPSPISVHEEEDTIQPSTLASEPIILYLNATQIVAAQIFGILDDIPDVTTVAIEDRSKTNALMKVSSMIPLIWFAVRVVAKRITGQVISRLELASSTYILCSLLAYVLYWSKPQGVERSMDYLVEPSNTVRPVTDQDLEVLEKLGGSSFLRRNFVPPFGMDGQSVRPTQPIPTGTSLTAFAAFGSEPGILFADDDFAGTLVGVIFGGLYFLGWDSSSLSSMVERVAR
ncbi:hypothetical protein N0V84_003180 [Fusarium piperis]|uniref:Uncharacterized protein n=1 Tax=Fusarium piperis TaxID=1435070 RepID=A0A9W9BR09_9HYPO|nr:hypothetical protein N0V84_003180 [Fusarium piperis]